MKLIPLAALALLTALAGCADAPTRIAAPEGGVSHNRTVRVDVFCPAALWVGESNFCSATAYDSLGNQTFGSTFWSSSDPYSISVNGGNVYAGATPGATIYADINGVTGYSYIRVDAPPVLTTITVSPTPTTVTTGSTRQLTATAKNQYGNTMSGYTFTWSSSNTAVATVSSSGLVTGVSAGSATITASAGGKSGSASVTVSNPTPSIWITGPSSVTRYQSAQYTATANGGVTPYTYQWRTRQGNAWSWGAWQSWYSTGSTNYTFASVSGCGITRNQIEVMVTGGNGATATSSMTSTVSNPC